jgi:hypothetical protein
MRKQSYIASGMFQNSVFTKMKEKKERLTLQSDNQIVARHTIKLREKPRKKEQNYRTGRCYRQH